MPLDGTSYETKAGVNTLELLKLADFIAKCPLKFKMEHAYAIPECGTAGCIKGHAALMWGHGSNNHYFVSKKQFSKRLGLNEEQTRLLCFNPENATPGITYHQISSDPSIAVRAIRRLALTGEVSFA